MKEKIYYKGIPIESNTNYKATESLYDFWIEDTVPSNNKEYFSSSMLVSAVNERIAFLLKDLNNVVLDFNGATLVFHGRIVPFILDNCENVTIKNFKIDYDRPFYTQASVLECDSKHMRIRMDKDFPYRVEDGYLYASSETWENKLNCNNCLLWLYDKTGHKHYDIILGLFGPEIYPNENPPIPIRQIMVEEQGEDIVLTGEFPETWEPNDGNNCLIFTHEKRDKNTITLVGCKDTHIENFILIHGASMAITAMRCENIYMDNFSMYMDYQGNGRMVTNNADAIHCFTCYGDIVLKNSYMDGLLDDVINVHNQYLQVQKVDKRKLVLSYPGTSVDIHCPMFVEGDYAAIYRLRTLEKKGRYQVKRITIDEQNRQLVFEFDEDMSDIQIGDMIENISAQPSILIENCKFGRFRGTSRLQSRGKIIVRNCEFNNEEFNWVFAGDMTYWFESGPVEDFTIENCIFNAKGGTPRIVFMGGEVEYTEKENYYHRNIKVKNCHFHGGVVASLYHVENFEFKDNTSDIPMVIRACECIGLDIDNATIT